MLQMEDFNQHSQEDEIQSNGSRPAMVTVSPRSAPLLPSFLLSVIVES